MTPNKGLLNRSFFPWLGLATCVLLTFTAWVMVNRSEQRRLRERFEAETLVIRNRIAQRIAAHEQLLLATTSFSSHDAFRITRQQWRHYVESLDLERLNPGVQAMGYAEWIPLSALKAHVARVRAEGFPEYEVHPGGPLSPEGGVSSNVYIEPFDARNQRAFSLDMLAESSRRVAMTQARDTGRVVLSSRVKLYQELGDDVQAGTILYAAAYRAGWPTNTVDERRKALVGWAYMAFRMDDLLKGILGEYGRGLDLALYDGESTQEQDLLHASHGKPLNSRHPWLTTNHFQVAGRIWTLQSAPGPGYQVLMSGGLHDLVLVVGLCSSLVIFVLLWFLLRGETQAFRLAEERLERLQTLLDSTGEGIYGIDTEGNGTFFNPACLQMLGYAEGEELLGKNIHWAIHHSRVDGTPYPAEECPIFRAFRTGEKIHVVEEVFWRRDGSSFPVECWSYPQMSQGRLVGSVVTFMDISARKRAESELVRTSERLALAARAGGVGVWEYDVVQNDLTWDDQMFCLYGVSPESFGGVYETWRAGLHPDDEARGDAEMRLALEGKKDFDTEFRVVWPDGSVHDIRAMALVQRDAHGRPLRMVGTNWDITSQKASEARLKESEARFRHAFESSPSAMSLTRAGDGGILQVNEAWIRLFGWPLEQALGRSLLDLGIYVNPGDRQELRRALEVEGRVSVWPLTAKQRDGSLMELLIGVAVIPIEGKSCYLSVLVDHTALKQAEAALREVNQTLEGRVAEELEQRLSHERALVHQSRLAAMGEMIGNIAHQWRQPLNALSVSLANIQDAHQYGQLTDEYLASCLGQGHLLIQKMSSTITDFMDYFRPDKAAIPFSLKGQAEAAIGLVSGTLQSHGVTVEIDEGPDVHAIGHPNEFSQVLLNLLNNAGDAIQGFSPTGGLIRVGISQDGANAQVLVTDNGGGIRITPIERIFEPYLTNKDSGTGLGLYMSRMILEQSMGGRIEARNIPGGAEFSITIPLAEGGHGVE